MAARMVAWKVCFVVDSLVAGKVGYWVELMAAWKVEHLGNRAADHWVA